MRENRAPVSLVLAARRKLPRTRGSSAAALGSVPSIHRGEANAPDGNLELFLRHSTHVLSKLVLPTLQSLLLILLLPLWLCLSLYRHRPGVTLLNTAYLGRGFRSVFPFIPLSGILGRHRGFFSFVSSPDCRSHPRRLPGGGHGRSAPPTQSRAAAA